MQANKSANDELKKEQQPSPLPLPTMENSSSSICCACQKPVAAVYRSQSENKPLFSQTLFLYLSLRAQQKRIFAKLTSLHIPNSALFPFFFLFVLILFMNHFISLFPFYISSSSSVPLMKHNEIYLHCPGNISQQCKTGCRYYLLLYFTPQ